MSTIAWFGVGVLALFAIAAWLTVWSRRDSWVRPAAVVLLLFGMPAIAIAGLQSLGHHRPMSLIWEITSGEYRVLAVKMVQDEAIYIYLDADRSEPWPVQLPWDNETAKRIQELQEGADGDAQGQFMFRYEPSLNTNAMQFHPLPQPQLMPQKPPEEPAPHLEQI